MFFSFLLVVIVVIVVLVVIVGVTASHFKIETADAAGVLTRGFIPVHQWS